jgi:hypothetical protein
MADLADEFRRLAAYVRTLPSFFFKHADYFSHFVLSVQLPVPTRSGTTPRLTLQRR